jgi:uncharacterized damage-inducible protein DinB
MHEVLTDAVRHNNWATQQLIEFCRAQDFTAEQLEVTGVGTYGGILATLEHIVRCDGSYVRRLAQQELAFVDTDEPADLTNLEQRNEQCRLVWEHVLSHPIEVERVVIVDDNTRGTRAGIFIAQALNHANHHREQVNAILTGFGIEPPDTQAWEYAWHTGRIWDLDKTS